ncbi:hypothetical protein IMG5_133440, partial [Ichthyophthirius multifiliis]
MLQIFSEEQIQEIINNILVQKNDQGILYLEQYNINYIQNYIIQNFKEIKELLSNQNSLDIVDFVYLMVDKIVDHTIGNYNDAIYISISLCDFFKAVCQFEQNKQKLTFKDISNFICQFNIKKQREIESKLLPLENKFNLNIQEKTFQDIDFQAPIILQENDSKLKRISKEKVHMDSVHHNKNQIIQSRYIEEQDQIITLDSYSDIFLFYNNDCKNIKKLKIQSQFIKGQACLDFFWSQKQQRIGSCFKDGFLAFWEARDNFQFEKVFQVGQIEEQYKIWYVETINQWITCDKLNNIYFWDLENEKYTHSISFSKAIIDVCEVQYLQKAVILIQENTIVLLDLIQKKKIQQLQGQQNKIHSIAFFKQYQTILTAGYDNYISIYNITEQFNDFNLIGNLKKHQTIITAIVCVENTPMVISADDLFLIKIWDIRTQTCIQNLNTELRNSIKQMHIMKNRLCLVTSKIIMFKFEENIEKNNKQMQDLYCINLQGNINDNKLYVCTNKDLRVYNLLDGKANYVIQSKNDFIESFNLCLGKKIILASKGEIKLYKGENYEEIQIKQPFKNREYFDIIFAIKVDNFNGLITMGTSNGVITIHKEISMEILRKINLKRNIKIIEQSVYHNILIICDTQNQILFFNYEYCKIMTVLQIEDDTTCIKFMDGYESIILSTLNGDIFIIEFNTNV